MTTDSISTNNNCIRWAYSVITISLILQSLFSKGLIFLRFCWAKCFYIYMFVCIVCGRTLVSIGPWSISGQSMTMRYMEINRKTCFIGIDEEAFDVNGISSNDSIWFHGFSSVLSASKYCDWIWAMLRNIVGKRNPSNRKHVSTINTRTHTHLSHADCVGYSFFFLSFCRLFFHSLSLCLWPHASLSLSLCLPINSLGALNGFCLAWTRR